jgi:hypothetical protein
MSLDSWQSQQEHHCNLAAVAHVQQLVDMVEVVPEDLADDQ